MKKIFIIVILVNLLGLISKAFSDVQWEDCTEGLEGKYSKIYLYEEEAELYSRSLPYSVSTDAGKSWIARRYFNTTIGREYNFPINDISKYKNRYIINSGQYISKDKKNIYPMTRTIYITRDSGGTAEWISTYTTDSSLIRRYYKYINKDTNYVVTCITKEEPRGMEGNFTFFSIPKENDFNEKDKKYTNFTEINDKIYATIYGKSYTYSRTYYYSTDWGWSWKADTVSEVFGGVKEIKYLNGKYFILSPITIWRQDENGEYIVCEDEQFDYLESKFLIAYKEKIITSAMETGTHKYVLASSTDGGKTWERFGTSEFMTEQLFAIGDTLVADTRTYGVMRSTDDGQTWVESNNRLYYSPEWGYEGQFMKISMNGNEAFTAPRNPYLDNTIMKSYNGGRSWLKKQIDPSLGFPEYSEGVGKYTIALTKWGLYAINRGKNTTYKSYDNGETWEFYSNGSIFHDAANIYERNDTMFYYYSSVKFPWIFYSIDTGKTQLIYDSTYKQKLPDNSHHLILVDGVYYATNNQNKLYKSTDGGNNWELIETFTMPSADTTYTIFWAIPVKDKLKIFIWTKTTTTPTKEDKYYVTEDFGLNWKQIQLPIDTAVPSKWLEINGNLYTLYFYDRGGYLTDTYIYHSSDDGVSWEEIAHGLDGKQITDILKGGDYLYVSTYEGLYRIYSPPVSVKESKIDEVLLPIELYPSPARDIIYVKNDYWGINEVKVYDMLGRECAVGHFNRNQFDISNLQPGVYLAKFIFPGNWSIIKKFVKM